MKLVTPFITGLILIVSTVGSANSPVKTKKNARLYVTHFENVLGTSMELKTLSISEKQAGIAKEAAIAEIGRLSKILSAYDAGSEFSWWLRTSQQPIVVSKDLYAVLDLFDQWRDRSNGALDASAGVVSKLWEQAAIQGQLPGAEALANAVAEVKQAHWKLDAAAQTATHTSGAPLILNSFAKSYIIKSAAAAAMAAANINGIIVNIGGDLVIAGDITETVKVSNPKADAENDIPLDRLLIHNKAIATSGNYRRGEMINGHWYSHIVDPRTGMPAEEIISATVIAASATDAGALATAFNVMKPAESIALAATLPNIDYLIITKNGERVESKNWKLLTLMTIQPLLKTAISSNNTSAEKEWKNEVVITLSLTQQPGPARRPFAAFWIEDSEKNTVKTIALWYNKARWLPDVKEWYRKNGKSMVADPAIFSSITSATRSPGKYTLQWDGKDDKGNILNPGTYTVYIEVVREHGGYDLLYQEMDCNKKPQSFTLKGTIEVESALIEYRKKTSGN